MREPLASRQQAGKNPRIRGFWDACVDLCLLPPQATYHTGMERALLAGTDV
jgi:hypothetical protein